MLTHKKFQTSIKSWTSFKKLHSIIKLNEKALLNKILIGIQT